ncbi:MAG: hypothetical protein AMS16_00690 [Planctomycetes bacterium DG_58]|nr:MAG: hypothetical protein AMS16_00690 [Planctomycetes bacterium DG_58]
MLGWLRSIFDWGPIEVTGGPGKGIVRRVAKDLVGLRRYGRDVMRRTLQYFADGQDESILGTLAGLRSGAGQRLHLYCCADGWAPWMNEEISRTAMLVEFRDLDPMYHLRLAQIYEAISRRDIKTRWLEWLPDAPLWLDVYLQEAWRGYLMAWWGSPQKDTLHAGLYEQMLQAAGDDPSIIVKAMLQAEAYGSGEACDRIAEGLPGLAEVAGRYPNVVRAAIVQGPAAARARTLMLLAKWQTDVSEFGSELVQAAAGSAKTVRQGAMPLLRQTGEEGLRLALKLLEEGKPNERFHVVTLVEFLSDGKARTQLASHLETEKSRKVRQAIEQVLASAAPPVPAEEAAVDPRLELPPIEPVDMNTPPPDDFEDRLLALCERWYADARASYDKQVKAGYKWAKAPVRPSPGWIRKAVAAVRCADPRRLHKLVKSPEKGLLIGYSGYEPINQFVEQKGLHLVHVVRLLLYMGQISYGNTERYGYGSVYHVIGRHMTSRSYDSPMRTLAAVFKAHGLDDQVLGRDWLGGWAPLHELSVEDAWPYFAERLELIEEALGPKGKNDYMYASRRSRTFEVLAAFPALPSHIVHILWQVALGTGKSDRLAAQRCLEKVRGCEARVIQALEAGQQDIRATAASWLGDLKATQAVPALKTTIAKEKSEVAKAAMMSALEAMGVPVDEFMSVKALVEESRKGLKKGIPPALGWVRLELIPEVCWESGGEPVDREILAWMLVKALKVGSPEPSPMLRHYARWFVREDAERFGQWILDNWIGRDTVPMSRKDALEAARAQAKSVARYYKDRSEKELTEMYLKSYLSRPSGSAIKEKGILAVSGACCGPAAASSVERYLKEWYGHRAAQCKALIRMLSWVERPSSIQVVLSVANRFRTAGIRREAESVAQALAERKGWTRDELSDRTIPTAGLEESGEIVLDTGHRRITGRLDADMQLAVVKADGKTAKSFPGKQKNEEEDAYKRARSNWNAARKELKSVLRLQKSRLYEAMCTQREWRFDDWDRWLRCHPIVGRYCQRLVWAAFDGEQLTITFRVLADGSLTDVDDKDVTVPGDAILKIAHTCNVPADLAEKWQRHLVDYEVEPLFIQFGRKIRRLTDAEKRLTSISDYEGYIIESFKLRGAATKLGWVRGQAEDGGWFMTYVKSFPTLEMEALIEFTGSMLPEENIQTALVKLSFAKMLPPDAGYYARGGELPLARVPAVLLSECVGDLAEIALAGTGFDPEWQKKVYM